MLLAEWRAWWKKSGAEQLSGLLEESWDPFQDGRFRAEAEAQLFTLARRLHEGATLVDVQQFLHDLRRSRWPARMGRKWTSREIVLRRSVPHLNETLPTAACARPGAFSGLAAEHATAPQSCGANVTGLYLPREVFFGRLVFAGAFVPVCASDFGRFFPATSGSFRLICSRSDTSDRGYPTRRPPVPAPWARAHLRRQAHSSQPSSLVRVTGFALPVLVEEFLSPFRQKATAAHLRSLLAAGGFKSAPLRARSCDEPARLVRECNRRIVRPKRSLRGIIARLERRRAERITEPASRGVGEAPAPRKGREPGSGHRALNGCSLASTAHSRDAGRRHQTPGPRPQGPEHAPNRPACLQTSLWARRRLSTCVAVAFWRKGDNGFGAVAAVGQRLAAMGWDRDVVCPARCRTRFRCSRRRSSRPRRLLTSARRCRSCHEQSHRLRRREPRRRVRLR